jgi:hypothetical protein
MAKKKSKAAKKGTAVEAVKHQDERTNIPAREQGAMAAEEEAAPRSVLYPRYPSRDRGTGVRDRARACTPHPGPLPGGERGRRQASGEWSNSRAECEGAVM